MAERPLAALPRSPIVALENTCLEKHVLLIANRRLNDRESAHLVALSRLPFRFNGAEEAILARGCENRTL
jgi:hypothetical protein